VRRESIPKRFVGTEGLIPGADEGDHLRNKRKTFIKEMKRTKQSLD